MVNIHFLYSEHPLTSAICELSVLDYNSCCLVYNRLLTAHEHCENLTRLFNNEKSSLFVHYGSEEFYRIHESKKTNYNFLHFKQQSVKNIQTSGIDKNSHSTSGMGLNTLLDKIFTSCGYRTPHESCLLFSAVFIEVYLYWCLMNSVTFDRVRKHGSAVDFDFLKALETLPRVVLLMGKFDWDDTVEMFSHLVLKDEHDSLSFPQLQLDVTKVLNLNAFTPVNARRLIPGIDESVLGKITILYVRSGSTDEIFKIPSNIFLLHHFLNLIQGFCEKHYQSWQDY